MMGLLLGTVASSALMTPPIGGDGDFLVTVPAGKVSEDLSGFPLMVDLRYMPASFWTRVNGDGSNIRVYTEDGSAQLPHDITSVNKHRKDGRVYVKTDVATATDTTVRIEVGEETSKLPVGDTYGRNAVWADYEVVWVFPELDNRTGNTYTQNMSQVEPTTAWRKVGYTTLTGTPHQGIATDGAGSFVSNDDNYLRRMNDSWVVQASNADPIGDSGIVGVNHLGDGFIRGGELFMPMENYPSGTYNNQHIVVFDATTLAFKRSYDISAQAHEASGMASDGTHIFVTDYTDSDTFYKYTMAGVFVEPITLSQSLVNVQGVEIVDGKLLFAIRLEELWEVEFDGTVNERVYTDDHAGNNEGLCYDGTKLYAMDVDGDLVTLQIIPGLSDYRRTHYQSVTTELPRFTTWTAAASIFWTVVDLQQAFISLSGSTGVNGNAWVGYDEGPDNFAVYDNSNSWMQASPAIAVKSYDDQRVAFSYNGTAGRRLWYDGVLAASEGTSAQRPAGSGTNMDFNINSKLKTRSEYGELEFQYVWLRNEVMSDGWMAADAANMNAPGTFYTITVP